MQLISYKKYSYYMKEEIYKNYNLTADDIVQISQDVYEFRANNKKYVAIRGIYNTEQINQSFIIAKYLMEKNGVESLRLMPVLGNSFNLIIFENSIIKQFFITSEY